MYNTLSLLKLIYKELALNVFIFRTKVTTMVLPYTRKTMTKKDQGLFILFLVH